MKLLPYDSFTIETLEALPLVIEKLANYIEPPKGWGWYDRSTHAPYQGTLSETGFEIRRIIHYRNSFLPTIRGRFEPCIDGTRIHVTMGLHPFIIAFLSFWYLTWYSFSIPIWLAGAVRFELALSFVGLPLVILGIFWGAFWYEAHRSHSDLQQMILGEKGLSLPTSQQRYNNGNKLFGWRVGFSILSVVALLWQLAMAKFFPSTQPEPISLASVSCSVHPTVSPDCNFKVVRTIAEHSSVSAIAISADGQTLVSGGLDKAIKVWNLKTGQLLKTIKSDSGKILAVAIAPDGKTVVSGSADRMVRVWNLGSNKRPLVLAGHPDEVRFIGITPDGQTIISGSYTTLKMWELATGKLKATLPNQRSSTIKIGSLEVVNDSSENFRPLAIHPSSNTAILDFLGGGVKVWNLKTNKPDALLNENFDVFAGYLLSASISPDGKFAAVQYSNSSRKFETRLKVWDLTTGKVIARGSTFFSHDTFIDIPLALSQEHIFGSTNGQLKVWNLQTAKLEAMIDAEGMNPLFVSPDGQLLIGVTGDPYSDNTIIKVWQR